MKIETLELLRDFVRESDGPAITRGALTSALDGEIRAILSPPAASTPVAYVPKCGDRVRVVRHRPGTESHLVARLPVGSTWTIIRPSTQYPGAWIVDETRKQIGLYPDEMELDQPAPVASEARPKFKVGDRVRCVKNSIFSIHPVGHVGPIIEFNKVGDLARIGPGKESNWSKVVELEPAPAAKTAREDREAALYAYDDNGDPCVDDRTSFVEGYLAGLAAARKESA